MPKGTHQYNAKLARLLRLRGIDEAQIRDATWSVESHVTDSGSTAEEAFGSPRRYARTFTQATDTPSRGWGWYVLAWLIASLAAALLLISWSARDDDEVLGLFSPEVGIVLGAAVLLIWALVLGLRLTRRPGRQPV